MSVLGKYMGQDGEETVGDDVETGKNTVFLETLEMLVYKLETHIPM